MRYILALLCPPLAMFRAGRPTSAAYATGALALAALTWTSGLGPAILAAVILWSFRVVGDRNAREQFEAFLELARQTTPTRRGVVVPYPVDPRG